MGSFLGSGLPRLPPQEAESKLSEEAKGSTENVETDKQEVPPPTARKLIALFTHTCTPIYPIYIYIFIRCV